MKLWLVRHARPRIAPGVCYGRTDVEAEAAHTEAVAHALAGQLPPAVPVLSSPLRRCAQLALRLAELRPDLAPTWDARLRELDFGTWEGRAWDTIAREEIDAWQCDFAGHAPGGGESVRDFMARVAEAYDARAGAAAWITHAGVIRAVHLLQQGVRCASDANQWPREVLAYGAVRMVGGGTMPGGTPGAAAGIEGSAGGDA